MNLCKHKAVHKLHTEEDLEVIDLNKYTTKKTISQGLIDIALLSANASQLNFILKIGEIHRFYSFLIVAIGASILVQLLQVLVCTFLGGLNINKRKNHGYAIVANDFILYTNALLIIINALISAFELKDEYTFRRNGPIENATLQFEIETTTFPASTYLPRNALPDGE